jgi:uncharacterized protein (TIGR02145 family)
MNEKSWRLDEKYILTICDKFMIKLLTLLIMFFFVSISAFSQSVTLFDVDATDFSLMRAKFYAFDEAGNQQPPSINQLNIIENGVERTITNVSCPSPQPPIALSSVLTIDVSGSMQGNGLNMAQEAARAWVGGLPLGHSECAITSFDHNNYLNQDFTTDRARLLDVINSLKAQGGTDYNVALLNPSAGGLQISRKGQYQKVIVMLTDGMPNSTPDVNRIVAEANSQNCIIYAVTLGMRCPDSLKNIATQTGGQWYENITTVEQARAIYMKILRTAQGGEPCTIEWQSGAICNVGLVNVELQWNLAIGKTTYTPPIEAVRKLEYDPQYIRFEEPEPGVWQSTIVRVTARNAQFIITDIEISDSSYEITPKSFTLNQGESIDLTVRYFPEDLGYTFCRFTLINETCQSGYSVSGGIPGLRPKARTIELIHPNGGEVFIAGNDTVIAWSGVLADEPVKLEYRTSDESEWVTVADSATGLRHPFRVPNIESDTYSARVSSAIEYVHDYCEVEIGNQIWMCENLDVTHYRNGDEIPQVQDSSEWASLTTGAWCYYDNDPENGEVYGKLYNWYAVNDPRGLAPESWRVPSDDDWKELEVALGMTQQQADLWASQRGTTQGAKLAGGYELWQDGVLRNHTDFNSSGFSGLPGGTRNLYGSFSNIRSVANWGSSTEYSSTVAIGRALGNGNARVTRGSNSKSSGFSVRCVRD